MILSLLGATYTLNFQTKIPNMTTSLYEVQTIRPHNNDPLMAYGYLPPKYQWVTY
jgi:hypothetical protein